MKKVLYILLTCLSAAACSVDLKDENASAKVVEGEASFVLNVNVSGSMVSAQSEANSSEMAVSDYSIYVFDVSSGELEYKEEGIEPSEPAEINESTDYQIGSKEITLPTSGSKEIFAIANASGQVTLPESNEDEISLYDFINQTTYSLDGESVPESPFVMTAQVVVSDISGAVVPLLLHRVVAKVNIINGEPDAISLSSVKVSGAYSSTLLFGDAATYTDVIDYPEYTTFSQGEDALPEGIYLLPAKSGDVSLEFSGTYDGKQFNLVRAISSDIYSDYNYTVTVRRRGTAIAAVLDPDFDQVEDQDPIIFHGDWMSATNEVTLPFTAEPNYGFTINFDLNVDGSPALVKNDEADWYSVAIENDTTIRIRTLKDNTGTQRNSSVTLKAGSSSLALSVLQQGVEDVGTVSICGMDWMDRNLGATLPANMANVLDKKAFGYYYQWGRNVPFPADGGVSTVSNQMTPSEALSSSAFIAVQGGTQDWNSNGTEGSIDTGWDTVSPDPCPEGYRLPTYIEIAKLLPFRLNALVMAGKVQKRTVKLPDGTSYAYLGYGSNSLASAPAIYGIMYKGTDDAYYIRWEMPNTGGVEVEDPNNQNVHYLAGGQNYVHISIVAGDASSTYGSLADAKEFWSGHTMDAEELYVPCAGRYDQNGQLDEVLNSALYWTGSMYKGNNTANEYASGMFYFRPSAKYMIMSVPAFGTAAVYTATEAYAYRSQAMPVRCIKK